MTERETVLLREFKEKLDKLIDLQLKIKSENSSLKEALLEKEECFLKQKKLFIQDMKFICIYYHMLF